jgi:hypothetical protein
MRGRRLTVLLAAGLLCLAMIGCGGGDPIAPQVPGEPADVRIPEADEPPGGTDANATDEGTTGEDTGTTGEPTTEEGTADGTTPAPEATAEPVDPAGATVPDEGGGAAAPETAPDSPENDTPPPAGSDAEQFEDFCAQNPGAC